MKAKKATPAFRKAPQAPKRFRSAFILFSRAKRNELKLQLGPTAVLSDIAKQTAQIWHRLPPVERHYWEEMGRRDKLRYEQEKLSYSGPWQISTVRGKKDPTYPKRPMSAFLHFARTERAKLKTLRPDLTFASASSLLGERWNTASVTERKPHLEWEEGERAVYNAKAALWREQDAKKREAREQEALNTAMQNEASERKYNVGCGGNRSMGVDLVFVPSIPAMGGTSSQNGVKSENCGDNYQLSPIQGKVSSKFPPLPQAKADYNSTLNDENNNAVGSIGGGLNYHLLLPQSKIDYSNTANDENNSGVGNIGGGSMTYHHLLALPQANGVYKNTANDENNSGVGNIGGGSMTHHNILPPYLPLPLSVATRTVEVAAGPSTPTPSIENEFHTEQIDSHANKNNIKMESSSPGTSLCCQEEIPSLICEADDTKLGPSGGGSSSISFTNAMNSQQQQHYHHPYETSINHDGRYYITTNPLKEHRQSILASSVASESSSFFPKLPQATVDNADNGCWYPQPTPIQLQGNRDSVTDGIKPDPYYTDIGGNGGHEGDPQCSASAARNIEEELRNIEPLVFDSNDCGDSHSVNSLDMMSLVSNILEPMDHHC